MDKNVPFITRKEHEADLVFLKRHHDEIIPNPEAPWWKDFLLKINPNETKLNIGCGSDFREGWVNIDGVDTKGVNLLADVRQLHMFADETVDEIYAAHVLEHFPYSETLEVLKEWTRVLKVGGTITIYVPDVGKLAHLYVQGSWQIGPPGSERNLVNCICGNVESNEYGWHKAIFDKKLIGQYLQECGYVDLQISESDRGHEFELLAKGMKGAL